MDFLTNLFGAQITNITPSEVQTKRNQKPPRPLLIDVREPAEFQSGHIPGAKLIPLGELSGRMAELPKDQEIICVCASGSRSISAARRLSKAGYTVVNMSGGMAAWQRAKLPVTKK